jgi:hypothetical protein
VRGLCSLYTRDTIGRSVWIGYITVGCAKETRRSHLSLSRSL